MIRRLATMLTLALMLGVFPLGRTVVLAVPPETVSVRLDGLLPEAASDDVRRPAAVGGAVRSAPARPAVAFAMVGLELPDGATAEVRTSRDGTRWGPWVETEVLAEEEGPDAGSAEARRQPRGLTEAVWVGPSRFVQVAVAGGDVRDVEVVAIDPVGLDERGERRAPQTRTVRRTAVAEAATTAGLDHVSRAEWGADESLRNGGPRYARKVDYAVVHHTAGSNDYRAADAPAVVRGIYHYHTRTLGWDDIGYNVLVDRYGTVYEGRTGGLDRAVIGAHAAGYNTGSFGISVMGNFSTQSVPEVALTAVAETVAWKFGIEGIDPYATVTASNGARVAALSAHRDVGRTACPGDAYYAALPRLRGMVAERVPPPGTFTDMRGSVHADAVERIAAEGITTGCTPDRYCPAWSVTRAQMATFLARALELPEAEPATFTDVPPSHAHADGIARVVAAGIAGGHPDGTYRPDTPINREQMAAMLRRGLDLEPEEGVRFADTVDSPYRSAINALSTAQVTGGCGGDRYCPGDPVSRAQMASFLDRALDHLAASAASEDGADDGAPADGDDPQA